MFENYLNVFLMTKMIHCAFFSLGPFWRSSSKLTCCSVEVNIINMCAWCTHAYIQWQSVVTFSLQLPILIH